MKLSDEIEQRITEQIHDPVVTIGVGTLDDWQERTAKLEQQVSAIKTHAKTTSFVCICCPLETTPGTFLGPDGNWYCEEHFKEIITKEQTNA